MTTDRGGAATLTGPSRAARSGTTRSLAVLLHGYGADGADLIGLADALAPALPDTAFLAPDAPEPCRVNPMGRQWFPISWIDGCAETEMRAGFAAAGDLLEGWLTDAMARAGVGPESTTLIGFSQGTMMSLDVGPRLATPLAGIVGFSGRLADAARRPVSTPPVMLIHGDRDEVIPVGALTEAAQGLAAHGFPVQWHVSRGTGHGIAPDGLQVAARFLAERLNV